MAISRSAELGLLYNEPWLRAASLIETGCLVIARHSSRLMDYWFVELAKLSINYASPKNCQGTRA